MQQEQSPPEVIRPQNIEPFPPSIMKLAQTYDLGQPQQEYLAAFPLDPHRRAIGLTIAVGLCALLPILLIIFLKVLYPWITIWIATTLLLTLLIWTSAFLRQYRYKKTHYQRVYVCTLGLL